MSDATADRILSLIDAGLQSSDETGYGTDRAPDSTLCARCQLTEPVEGGDLCLVCRAFLLGDSDQDPTTRSPHGFPVYGRSYGHSRSEASIRWQAMEMARYGAGWFLRGGGVLTVECMVCGSPVVEASSDLGLADDRFLDARPWAPPRITLSPCGHTEADASVSHLGAELYRLTQHPIDGLGGVMWWSALWTQPAVGTRPRLADVLAETDMVTFLDHDGQVVDRIRYRPAPGTVDVLYRPAPAAMMSVETTSPEATMLQVPVPPRAWRHLQEDRMSRPVSPGWPDDEWLDIDDPNLVVEPPSVTVDVAERGIVGTILGPDGEPLHTVLEPRTPFGFTRSAP